MKLHKDEHGYIVEGDLVAFTYATDHNPRELSIHDRTEDSLMWDTTSNIVGDYKIIPYGDHNNLPMEIRNVIQRNYIAPGLLYRQKGLLWGSGPRLYEEDYNGEIITRKYKKDNAINKWLKSFDYEKYILDSIEDFNNMQGCFTAFVQSKGYKIGKPFFNKLYKLSPKNTRLAYRGDLELVKPVPTHIIETDFTFSHPSHLTDIKQYPILDYNNPFKHGISAMYSNLYTFCTDYYSVPLIYGSLEWLRRSTAVPLIFKALSKNSINVKYHIESPAKFWDKKREIIEKNCRERNVIFKEEYLTAEIERYLTKLSEVLSGQDNSGKFLHTVKEVIVEGHNLLELGWTITPIDQNIKDFVESQIKISERADKAVASGISIHSALGNMQESGKTDSGSEQYYALLGYLSTAIDIPETIVLKSINLAIESNFPDSGLKLGFNHYTPERQQDVSPENRSINNIGKK
jgi:hypothetical protein